MVLPLSVSPAPYAGSYGSPFGPVNTITLAANGTHVLPYGNWLVETGAHDTVTHAISAGTTLTVLPATSTGYVVSDGTNVEILADATGGTVSTYLQVLGL